MTSDKQLVTQLQAEYLLELRKHEDIKQQFEASSKRMERLVFMLNQENRLRAIRDRKVNPAYQQNS